MGSRLTSTKARQEGKAGRKRKVLPKAVHAIQHRQAALCLGVCLSAKRLCATKFGLKKHLNYSLGITREGNGISRVQADGGAERRKAPGHTRDRSGIPAREFVVFVGPSGYGKSRFLPMLSGLERITAKRYNVQWKTLARFNRKSLIRPFYLLRDSAPHREILDVLTGPFN
jgi:hypothetical protein